MIQWSKKVLLDVKHHIQTWKGINKKDISTETYIQWSGRSHFSSYGIAQISLQKKNPKATGGISQQKEFQEQAYDCQFSQRVK